jgi:hypothetical protein
VAVDPGATDFWVDVSVTNDEPVHGISLSLRHDTSHLTLTRIDPGAATTTTPFFEYKHDPATGEVVSGIILTYPDSGGSVNNGELPATDAANPHVADVLVFSLDAAATPGDLSIDLVNGLGVPAVSNSFSDTGIDVPIPQVNLTNGAVSVNNLHRLRLADANAVPNSSFSVTAEVQSPQPISGGSFAYVYDNIVFSATDATYLFTDADTELRQQVDLGSAGIEFFLFENQTEFFPGQDRAVAGFVNDFTMPFNDQVTASTGPDEWKSVIRFRMTVVNDPALVGSTRDLVLTDANQAGQVDNRFVAGRLSVQPDFFHGQVTFVEGFLFLRGDANDDGRIDISDAIWNLQWQFLGISEPACHMAADVNGDGQEDISDTIDLLTWLLLGGTPPPPIDGCGVDPNGSELSCDMSSCNS